MKTGSINWLDMGLRYDLHYATKKQSRVADCPTLDADYLMQRQLQYTSQTTSSRLVYSHVVMMKYKPPPTRRKPADLDDSMYDLVEE